MTSRNTYNSDKRQAIHNTSQIDKKTLFIADGTALAYRSYFAFIKNPLYNSKGENTSAVYGVLNSIIRLIEDYQPDHLVFAFDIGGVTFRHEMYDEYKATREKMPDDLRTILPKLYDAIEALGIPIIKQKGIEADDLLATLAQKAKIDGYHSIIVTGDKDIFQIIDDDISILTPSRGFKIEEKLWTKENAAERMGVPPEQIVDLLALMGDSSDNVPGVHGIGQKGAQKLLEKYGNLDEIYEHLDEQTKSVKTKLENGRADAYLSKKLVTLDNDIDLTEMRITELDGSLNWKCMELGDADYERLREILQELELQNLIKKLVPEDENPVTPIVMTDPELIRKWLDKAGLNLGVFPLWQGSKPYEGDLVGLAIYSGKHKNSHGEDINEGIYIPLDHYSEGQLMLVNDNIHKEDFYQVIKSFFGSKNIVCHDLKETMHLLGLKLTGFDVKLASWLLAPAIAKHTIEFDISTYMHRTVKPISDFLPSKNTPVNLLDPDIATRECVNRAAYLFYMHDNLISKLKENALFELYSSLEMKLLYILYELERTGVFVDKDILAGFSEEFKKEASELESKAFELADEEFNLDSPKQLREILFDKLGLPVQRKTKTGPSTDIEVLEFLSNIHELPKLIVRYRHVRKLVNTYTDVLPKMINKLSGRVHSVFHQAVVSTGRLSSSDPNLQNIPVRGEDGRKIRGAFKTNIEDHVLLSADYSQIELRLLAHISGDEHLKEAFLSGEDIHTNTAAKIFKIEPSEVTSDHRSVAKAVNYGISYGLSAYGLSGDINVSMKEAKAIIDEYFAMYPKVKEYMENTVEQAKVDGYVTTLLGRRRYIHNISSQNYQQKQIANRTAINTPIQGTSADMIKLAMIKIYDKLESSKLRATMILQIHDELLFEVHRDDAEELASLVKTTMEEAMKLDIPIDVDVNWGDDWASIH